MCVSVLLDCAERLATLKVKIPHLATSKRRHPAAAPVQINLSDSDEDDDSEDLNESEEGEEKKVEDELLWVTVQESLSSKKWSVRFKTGWY